MRIMAIAFILFLLSTAVCAAGTVGVYFTRNPGQMTYQPTPMEMFDGYIYVHNAPCNFDAIEMHIEVPPGIAIGDYIFPQEGAWLLTELGAVSFVYPSAFNATSPGYNLICTLHLLAVDWCAGSGGTLTDAPIRIMPSGKTGFLRVSCHPHPPEMLELTGLSSIICPQSIGTDGKSWSAIKSLYK